MHQNFIAVLNYNRRLDGLAGVGVAGVQILDGQRGHIAQSSNLEGQFHTANVLAQTGNNYLSGAGQNVVAVGHLVISAFLQGGGSVHTLDAGHDGFASVNQLGYILSKREHIRGDIHGLLTFQHTGFHIAVVNDGGTPVLAVIVGYHFLNQRHRTAAMSGAVEDDGSAQVLNGSVRGQIGVGNIHPHTVIGASAQEQLCPLILVGGDSHRIYQSNTQMLEVRIHDIGPMGGAVHPGIVYLNRVGLARGDVLAGNQTSQRKIDAGLCKYGIERTAVGTVVIIPSDQLLCTDCSCTAQQGEAGQRHQALGHTGLVGQHQYMGCKVQLAVRQFQSHMVASLLQDLGEFSGAMYSGFAAQSSVRIQPNNGGSGGDSVCHRAGQGTNQCQS